MESKIIGFTCSSFDLLHAGHIIMLEECKKQCDYLIVGLNSSPIKRNRSTVQGLFERYIQLNAVKWVDEIIPYNGEDELIQLFESLDLDVRFIGEDYKHMDFTGKDVNNSTNTTIIYNKRNHPFSSQLLKDQVVKNQSKNIIVQNKNNS